MTDEEESGSSTSSCDELTAGGIPRDNSDTDSAASPGTREQTGETLLYVLYCRTQKWT